MTDAQLAAIRLTVRGFGSKAVARHLGLNHHTIGRWKRDPRFAAEVTRLRSLATQATVAASHAAPSVSPRAPSPPRPTPPMRRGDDDAIIDRLLRLTRRAP